jgi:LPXTG-site transpeptidase (sortase) family protein
MATHSRTIRSANEPQTTRARVFWTLGNLLALIGMVVLLYAGGLYAQAEFGRYAARGDTDVAVAPPPLPAAEESVEPVYQPSAFDAPVLNDGRVTGAAPPPVSADYRATISRIMIPSIGVDSKVVEVGWEIERQKDGSEVAVWQVAEYAVGQHRGTANPGENENIVLAGHVGGYGKVFKDLIYVRVGDPITLFSNGQQYLYVVHSVHVVTEEGASAEQRRENANWIQPTGQELVTLVTCWPPSGPKKYSQRVIVRALPFGSNVPQPLDGPAAWNIR